METERLLNQNANSNRKFLYPSKSLKNLDGHSPADQKVFKANKNFASNIFVNKHDQGDNKASEETELVRLRPRGVVTSLPSYTAESHPTPPANVVYLEREILSNDTLQSFALLYGCTLNDLKRANNLINEQDFFGLRRIKIPVKKHGLLTEPEEEIKRRPVATTSLISFDVPSTSNNLLKNQPLNDVYLTSSDDITDDMENHFLLHPKASNLNKDTLIEANDTGKFLKSVDKEIRKTIKNSDKIGFGKNEALEEVVSSLGSIGYRPLPLPSSKAKDCDGSSWGVNWYTLLLFFVVCLVLVLICVAVKFYFINEDHSTIASTTINTNSNKR